MKSMMVYLPVMLLMSWQFVQQQVVPHMISKFCSDDPYVCVVLLVIFISSVACIVYCSVFLFYMKYMSLFFCRSIFLGQFFFLVLALKLFQLFSFSSSVVLYINRSILFCFLFYQQFQQSNSFINFFMYFWLILFKIFVYASVVSDQFSFCQHVV